MKCLVGPYGRADNGLAAALEAFFLKAVVLPLMPIISDPAARIPAEHGLETPDDLDFACALEHGYEQFWTNDQRFRSAAPNFDLRLFA